MSTRIVIGAAGRLGSAVCAALSAEHPVVGVYSNTRPAAGITAVRSLKDALSDAAPGVVIDCAPGPGVSERLRLIAEAGFPVAVGSTGGDEQALQALEEASKRIAVVQAPNFSPGLTVFELLLELSAKRLKNWDAALLDRHHREKRDRPSGTALRLAQAWPGEIPVASSRQGTVVGEHTLFLSGPGEELILTHRVQDRSVFARGAVLAAEFLESAAPGMYTMKDVVEQAMES